MDVYVEGEKLYVKDLRIFKNVKMEDMIIIDNSVLSFAHQLDNGIPILPFYDNYDDNELLFLKNYLCDISHSPDLRKENKARIKMDYFLQAAKGEVKSEYKSNQSEENKNELFVSSWGSDEILIIDVNKNILKNRIPVGSHPNDFVVNKNNTFLYVANANDNSVSVIDLKSKKVAETLNAALYPDAPSGSTTNGVALSENEKTI